MHKSLILNLKSSRQAGYTLIELTIVVGLVAILTIGISSVVLMNTITAARTRNQTHIRSSGDYSLNQLKTLIRNAKSLDTCDESEDSLTLTGVDGGSTTVALELESGNGRIASGSGNYLTPSDTNVTSFTVTCLPNESEPRLVKLSFDSTLSGRPAGRDNPVVSFETSITLRNE